MFSTNFIYILNRLQLIIKIHLNYKINDFLKFSLLISKLKSNTTFIKIILELAFLAIYLSLVCLFFDILYLFC